jgi:hypothetical protein
VQNASEIRSDFHSADRNTSDGHVQSAEANGESAYLRNLCIMEAAHLHLAANGSPPDVDCRKLMRRFTAVDFGRSGLEQVPCVRGRNASGPRRKRRCKVTIVQWMDAHQGLMIGLVLVEIFVLSFLRARR